MGGILGSPLGQHMLVNSSSPGIPSRQGTPISGRSSSQGSQPSTTPTGAARKPIKMPPKNMLIKFHADPALATREWAPSERTSGRRLIKVWCTPTKDEICWAPVQERADWSDALSRSLVEGENYAVISCLFWYRLKTKLL